MIKVGDSRVRMMLDHSTQNFDSWMFPKHFSLQCTAFLLLIALSDQIETLNQLFRSHYNLTEKYLKYE